MDRPNSPMISAARLWAKVSAKTGRQYLVGRWGGCRVLIFENADRKGDDEPSHLLMLAEAEDKPREARR